MPTLPRKTINHPSPLGKLLRQLPPKSSPTGFSPCLQAPKRLLCLRFKRVLGDKHVTPSNPKTLDYPPKSHYHLPAMKTLLPLTALAALVASGSIHAQTPAFSKPSGYVTTSLLQGFNLIGLNLQTPSLASGKFETVTATTLTDSDVTDYAPTSGRTYVLEITSGTIEGSIFEVPASGVTGNVITITTVPATDLVALGLTTNDTYNLRIAPTLEEIFTTTSLTSGGVLFASANINNADIVWLPDGTGGYDRYYLRQGAFRDFDPPNNLAPNIPIIYSDGMFVQKKNTTAASLTVTGNVKTIGTTSVITQGFNPVNLVAPVGLNLFNAGLEDDLKASANPTLADIVWVQDPTNLTYQKFFRRGTVETGTWRNVSVPNTALTQQQAEAISLSGAILIQKADAGKVNVDLKVPSGFSDL